MTVHILGLSALAHDPSAALLGPRGIVAAIEESKLIRARASSGIPRAAIRFCLERMGTDWQDVECIAVASRPRHAWRRRAWFRTKQASRAPMAGAYYHSKALGELARELNNLRILHGMTGEKGMRIAELDHHLCHAASAFFASPFDRAAILTLDEEGDGHSGLLAVGEGTKIRTLRSIPFPHSLGWLYSQVTEALGFEPHRAEHKTQWLSLEAEPRFRDVFADLLKSAADGTPRLDQRFFTPGYSGRVAFSDLFWKRLGLPGGKEHKLGEELRAQLAASVQQACAEAATYLARRLREETGAKNLCVAGGVFLNGLLAAEVEKNSGFESVFVQPAAGNEGTALGAAWLAWHELLGWSRVEPMVHLYWGPAYSNEEIKQVLDNCKSRYRWCNSEEEILEGAIQLLEAGRIVGWCQGEAEFGPRALGHRSLLASPWAPYVKENLNEYVKHREAFRPFAISVPEEDASEYFQWPTSARFMASMARVRPEVQKQLEGFLLPGGRVRLHVVERRANPLYWQLLKRFGRRAPAPILVNTSFNLFGEPLVVSPRDAVRSYFCSGVDALSIGSFLLSKTG